MQRLAREIERLKAGFRHLASLPHGIDFTSNDYLGLARHPALRRAVIEAIDGGAPVGAGASRLLRGQHEAHGWSRLRPASSAANARSLLPASSPTSRCSSRCRTGTTRWSSMSWCASVKEGIRAGHAAHYKVAHNDVNAFDDAIRRARAAGARDVFLAIESVYSMDGHHPVAELHALAHARDAVLIVDEAHASGVFGIVGRGVAEGRYDERLIALHTCGKALVAGGLLCGPQVVMDYLINAARPFIYSTAPPPMVAAAVRRARTGGRGALAARAAASSRGPRRRRLAAVFPSGVRDGGTQIVPVILGAESTALAAAAALQRAGFDACAIRPPTVPAGSSRLRVSIGAIHGSRDRPARGRAAGRAAGDQHAE